MSLIARQISGGGGGRGINEEYQLFGGGAPIIKQGATSTPKLVNPTPLNPKSLNP